MLRRNKILPTHGPTRGVEGRYEPADPGDFRFEITEIEEPEMGCTHLVKVIGDRGELIESFTTDDPYGAVAAAREAQSMTLEERLAPFGPEWEREQRERGQ